MNNYLINNIDQTNKFLDKIWDRNPSKSEVIGLFGGDEKTDENVETTKLNAKKRFKKKKD